MFNEKGASDSEHLKLRSVELRALSKDSPENSNIIPFEIFDENGQYLGYAALTEDPENTNQVLVLNIDIEFISDWQNKNKGYGNLIYEKLAEIVKKLGKKFISSGLANNYALKNWEYLVQKGIAKKDPSKKNYDTGLYFVEAPKAKQ